MTRRTLNPDGVAAPRGLYSHACYTDGPTVYVAGQVALDADGEVVGRGDLARQARQVLANLETVLQASGTVIGNVAKFTTYLVHAEDIATYYQVRAELFARYFPDGDYPANTLLVVDRLVTEELLIEIDAVATVPSAG